MVGHAALIANAAIFLCWHIFYQARRQFPNSSRHQCGVVAASLAVVVLASLVAVSGSLIMPDKVIYKDALRYFNEIQGIAEAFWEWNPITGTGPGYAQTPKMGMSYLYGIVLGLHQAPTLAGVLVLNVVMLYFTAFMVFLTVLRLTRNPTAAIGSMLLVAVYPETIFWTIRPARENLTLFLTVALVYASILLFETHRIRWLLIFIMITALLLLTRAQLVFFSALIVVYYGSVVLVRAVAARQLSGIGGVIGLALLAAMAAPYAAEQIQRASGAAALMLVDPAAIMHLLTLDETGVTVSFFSASGYGGLGIIIAPFIVFAVMLFAGTLIRFRTIFHAAPLHAGLLLFLIVVFMSALLVLGHVSIRFRATVSPLLICLVGPAAVYYWRFLMLPSYRILPMESLCPRKP